MDFDLAWCPACDRQIAPKRYTIQVPSKAAPPPPPPPSPKRSKGKTGGLVNGTGRLRHNGTIKASAAPPVIMKERTVIEQGPSPLYCSDECQFADIHAKRRSAPLDPALEEPQQSDAHSPTSSIEQFLKMYNLPPLPDVPVYEPPSPQPELPWTGGIMMAGRLIDSLCPPPQKPYVGRYRPVEEPRKPTKGWNDGSHAWMDAVYSKGSRNMFANRLSDPQPKRSAATALRQSLSSSHSSSVPVGPSPAESAEMISKFSQSFVRRSPQSAAYSPRSESTSSVVSSSSSPSSTQSLPVRRERSLVAKGAEGKLLVPDVKLKICAGSSGSISSSCSVPTTVSSRRSARSPLSTTSESIEDNSTERSESSTTRRPRKTMADTPRSWSYDNVLTYDAMPFIPKKVKKMEKRVVDGEEKVVEVEVEVYEERKQLFLFAPSVTRISV